MTTATEPKLSAPTPEVAALLAVTEEQINDAVAVLLDRRDRLIEAYLNTMPSASDADLLQRTDAHVLSQLVVSHQFHALGGRIAALQALRAAVTMDDSMNALLCHRPQLWAPR